MKKCKPRWTKIAIDWVERELTAVMAVAIVLAFIFSRSLATDTATQQSIVSTTISEKGVYTQQVTSQQLWTAGNIIKFGSQIKGQDGDTPPTVWMGNSVVNLGNCLYVPAGSATVTTTANNGPFNLGVTADAGSVVTINGVIFTFNSYSTLTKPVVISNNQIMITLKTGTKIFTIEAKATSETTTTPSSGSELTTPTIVPLTSLTIMPAMKTVVLSSVSSTQFTPIVVAKNSLGSFVDAALNWTSSDESIAAVDGNGVVTCKKSGTVTITATVTNTNLSASTSVKVLSPVTPPTINVTPAPSSSTTGTGTTGTQTPPATGGSADQTAPAAAPTQETTTNAQAPDVLDAFAAMQAKNYADSGTTAITQKQVKAIVDTQPTLGAKLATQVKLATTTIAQTFQEIFAGRTIKLPDGTQVKKPSAGQLIMNWVKNTFFGGVGAMNARLGGEEEELN